MSHAPVGAKKKKNIYSSDVIFKNFFKAKVFPLEGQYLSVQDISFCPLNFLKM
jgi:hypothetical protein